MYFSNYSFYINTKHQANFFYVGTLNLSAYVLLRIIGLQNDKLDVKLTDAKRVAPH